MWCTSVDPENNLITVTKRGMYGTTAAAHDADELVRNNPKFPRAVISRAINDTIRSVYPDLFAVASTTMTADLSVGTYELPSTTEDVLDVFWQDIGDTGIWHPVKRYRFNPFANTTEYDTGKSIDIISGVAHGQTIQVVYRKVPSALSSLSDDFATVSGLEDSAKECIVYGACARLVGYLEPARLSSDAAEARFMEQEPAGKALTAARYFYQMHLQARGEESRRLNDRYPPRIHFTR